MQIQVKLYAMLRRYGPPLPRGAALPLEVAGGTTVVKVLQRLGIPDHMPLVSMINTRVCKTDDVLSEGDTLSLFPPVAGG